MAESVPSSEVHSIIFACEAGMGSSLMSVNALKKKLKAAKIENVTVAHKPARAIPQDAQVVVVHKSLSKVVRKAAPQAVVVTFNHFFNDPVFDKLVQAFVNKADILASPE